MEDDKKETWPTDTIVKYEDPLSEAEAAQRFVIIENRFPRLLVTDVRFINNPDWPITPRESVLADHMILAE